MRAVVVFAILLTLTSFADAEPAFAQEAGWNEKAANHPQRPMRERLRLLRKKVRDQEANKKKSAVAFEITPLSTLVIPSVGFSYGSTLTKNHWLELGYAHGVIRLSTIARSMGAPRHVQVPVTMAAHEHDANKVYEDVQRLEIYHSLFSARVKSFWTETFYTNAGLGLRQIGLSYPIDEVSELNGLEADISISRPVVSFAAGNRWAWDQFILGVDWVATSVPLAWFASSGAHDARTTSERVNHFADSPSLSFFTIQTGILF